MEQGLNNESVGKAGLVEYLGPRTQVLPGHTQQMTDQMIRETDSMYMHIHTHKHIHISIHTHISMYIILSTPKFKIPQGRVLTSLAWVKCPPLDQSTLTVFYKAP